MEKLQENTKKNGKNNFNGTPNPHYGVLPKGNTKLIRIFGGKF